MNSQYFSQEGLEKLKAELENRMNVIRPEIAKRIKEAKELGDTSESAEMEEAKDAQAHNEGRIEELKTILENVIVIAPAAKGDTVAVGSSVKAESKDGAREFVIVGPAESNPSGGFISNESPLGSALIGHKKGESVRVKTPKGFTEYKILEVN